MKKTKKRKYDSSRRKSQAMETRRLILEAARDLFIRNGYAGATIAMIADQAGVSQETIYAVFKNKKTILSDLVSFSLKGDDEQTPLLEQAKPQAILHLTDQKKQVELFAEDIAHIMVRMAPLFAIIREAGRNEPEIAEMLQEMLASRAENMKVVANALLSNGPLRKGIDVKYATDTIWALTSGEIFTLLINDRGWSREKYIQWLTDGLIAMLLT
jgi:AcrR family transcriptional regulator